MGVYSRRYYNKSTNFFPAAKRDQDLIHYNFPGTDVY